MASTDIKSVISAANIALERKAADQFGSAVEDFAHGAIKGQPRPPNTPSGVTNGKTARPPRIWNSTSYAAGLAGTDFRPKLKFLFKVEFKFKRSVIDGLKAEGFAHVNLLEDSSFTFMIKTIDRPKVDFEYEDDVNQYNFRTKALKRIKHREMTITFMDDVGNRVFEFFRLLMYVHSPITRGGFSRDGTGNLPSTTPAPGMSGMSFTSKILGTKGSANRSVINSDFGGAIDVIRIKQMFLNNAAADPNDPKTTKENIYDFVNPRLVSFDLDDLTHDSSDPSLLTMQFDYDWMEMVHNGEMRSVNTPSFARVLGKNIEGAPGDILSGRTESGSAAGSSSIIAPAGGNNPYANILSGAASRAAQQLTSTAVGRAVTAVAGRGQFATNIGQRLGGVLGGSVNNLTSAASRDLFGSASNYVGGGITNTFSKLKTGFAQNLGAGNSGSSSASLSGDSAAGFSSVGTSAGTANTILADSTSHDGASASAYVTSILPGGG